MQQSSPQRKFRRRTYILVVVVAITAIAAAIKFSMPGPLSTTEKEFVGVWTWSDSPGEIVVEFRDDRTMRATPQKTGRVHFASWHVQGEQLFVDLTSQTASGVASRIIGRANIEAWDIEQMSDDSITVLLPANVTKTQDADPMRQIAKLIPWNDPISKQVQQAK